MAKLFVLPFFLFSLCGFSSQSPVKNHFLGSEATEVFSTSERQVEISLKFNKKKFEPIYNHFEVKCSDVKAARIKKLNIFYVATPATVSIEGDLFILKSTKKGKSYFVDLKTCSLEKVSYDD